MKRYLLFKAILTLLFIFPQETLFLLFRFGSDFFGLVAEFHDGGGEFYLHPRKVLDIGRKSTKNIQFRPLSRIFRKRIE